MIAHKLIFKDKKDYSFMCMELLVAVMVCIYKYQGLVDGSFNVSSYGGIVKSSSRQNSLPFSDFFKAKFEAINLKNTYSFPDEAKRYSLPSRSSLYCAILFTWCWMHGKKSVFIQHTEGDVYSIISNNHVELMKFTEMICLMQ